MNRDEAIRALCTGTDFMTRAERDELTKQKINALFTLGVSGDEFVQALTPLLEEA